MALAQVASSYFERQSRPIRTGAAEQEGSSESSLPSALSTLVGTGAIAAAGYRLVLRPPDDPETPAVVVFAVPISIGRVMRCG